MSKDPTLGIHSSLIRKLRLPLIDPVDGCPHSGLASSTVLKCISPRASLTPFVSSADLILPWTMRFAPYAFASSRPRAPAAMGREWGRSRPTSCYLEARVVSSIAPTPTAPRGQVFATYLAVVLLTPLHTYILGRNTDGQHYSTQTYYVLYQGYGMYSTLGTLYIHYCIRTLQLKCIEASVADDTVPLVQYSVQYGMCRKQGYCRLVSSSDQRYAGLAGTPHPISLGAVLVACSK